eukprot:gene1867-2592_t
MSVVSEKVVTYKKKPCRLMVQGPDLLIKADGGAGIAGGTCIRECLGLAIVASGQGAKTPKGRLDVGNIIRVQADPDNGNGLHIVHYRVEDGDGDQGVVDPKEYTLSCETFSPSARDDWLTTLSAAVVEQDGDGDLEVSGGGGGSREAHQPKTKKVIDGAEGEVEFGGFDSDDYGDD